MENLFHYFRKFMYWYSTKVFDQCDKKMLKLCNLSISTAEFIKKQKFVSNNEKAIFFAQAGDIALDCGFFNTAIRLYGWCIELANQLPKTKSLSASAFENINWIRQEQARIESIELSNT